MPDGDIIHNNLRRIYKKPYALLCEGRFTTEDNVRSILKALKSDLSHHAVFPVKLAQEMADVFLNSDKTMDYESLGIQFEKIINKYPKPHYLKALIQSSAKDFLHGLRYEGVSLINRLRNGHNEVNSKVIISEALLNKYIERVYVSRFKECIPLTQEHHAGVTQATLDCRLQEVEPDINKAITRWAKKGIENKALKGLYLPCQSPNNKIDLGEDLLCLTH